MDGPDRAAVVRRLVALEGEGRLGSEQVRKAAGALEVSERSVWRWVHQARAGEGLDRRPRVRFRVTDEIRQRVAFWRGNTAAVHRELAGTAKAGGPPAPSLSTLQRAVARDVLAGDRAGLAGGERARRAHDVFRACRILSRQTNGRTHACAGHQAAAAGSGLSRRPGSRRWCCSREPSVRPGTSTFPDTLATSPDTVRKLPSRKSWASGGCTPLLAGHQNCLKSASSVTKCDWMLVSSAPFPLFCMS